MVDEPWLNHGMTTTVEPQLYHVTMVGCIVELLEALLLK